MLNVKAILKKILIQLKTHNTKLSDYVKVVRKDISGISLAANGTYTATDIDPSDVVPSGYKWLDAYYGATGNNALTCYQCRRNGTKINLQLRNISSASISSATAIIMIICIKE